jgi:uncharacterized membrane protein YjjP (DUF1212 family)
LARKAEPAYRTRWPMPTFVAILAASVAGYLAGKLLGGVSMIVSAGLSFVVWVLVFYITKRFLSSLKP